MKVRVKEGKTGFIYGINRLEGQEFHLKPVTCKVEKDSKGEFKVMSVEQQFSDIWMDKLETPKKEVEKEEEIEEVEFTEEPKAKKKKKK